jgi:imidazole glycerol phosphate synthase glutamine amidotransferase subunit
VSRSSSTPEVLVVATGTANTASVIAALRRVGARPALATRMDDVAAARHVVLPGVGSFEAAMGRIDELGLRATLVQRIGQGRSTLAICLGLQVLCASSQESPGVEGLGLVDATVGRFPESVRVPHLGWNRVEPFGSELLEPGDAYFANSYRIAAAPAGWAGATTDYAGPFVSALERGAVLACQFHPELSGAWGSCLLARWIARTNEVD